MIQRGLAKRYARALFNTALKRGIADQIHEDVRSLQELLEEDSSFADFLLSPQVLTEKKVAITLKALEGRTDQLFIDFLLLLVDKKRFDHIYEIFDAYISIYEEHRGILKAKVVSAVPLDEAQEAAVLEMLSRETNKEIRLTKNTDPDIIGGLVVFLGEKIIDGSIKFQLESFRKTLKEAKVY